MLAAPPLNISVLHTERLILRPLEAGDLNEIFSLRSNEEVNKYLERQRDTTPEDSRLFIGKIMEGVDEKRCLYWGIQWKDDRRLIGTICVWNFSDDRSLAELGYELHPSSQGKGIMREAMKAVLDYLTAIPLLQTIIACTAKENEPSMKLLTSYHFELDANEESGDKDYNTYQLQLTDYRSFFQT